MSRPDRKPKQRTPTEQAEVVAGYFANHVKGLASNDITEHGIRNALLSTQKVLGTTFDDAADALKKELPAATIGPHPAGHVPLTTRIDGMAKLLGDKQQKESAELSADLDSAIRNANKLLTQLGNTKTKLVQEQNTLQAKTRTPDENTKLLVLKSKITSVETAEKNLKKTQKAATDAQLGLPTSKNSTIAITQAGIAGAKMALEELNKDIKAGSTEQYRTTNELFARLGGGVPPQIDTSVIAPLKAQTTDDATQKIYDTIKTKIDTINKKLEELHKLQAELAVPNGAASEKDIEKHQQLLNDIAEENTKLAKMFKDAQAMLGAHAELAGQSEKLEQLTVQLRAVPGGKTMPILGNATLELTKNELDQKFKCGTRTWNKMEKKWDTKQLNVNPTRTDIETFVTNWNASLAEWNKANPYDQRKPITLKGNPPHTMACGDEENRNKVEPVFCRAMQDAEKARATATATATTSPVPAAPTPGSH